MTHLLLRLVLLSALAFLAGCNPRATLPIIQTQYVVIEPEAKIIEDCTYPEPPDVELYLGSTLKQREGLLTGQVNESLDEIAKCNARWKTLREWIATQKQIYSNKKK